jgi:hypothetical protein
MVLSADTGAFLSRTPVEHVSRRVSRLIGDGWFELKAPSSRRAVLQCMLALHGDFSLRRGTRRVLANALRVNDLDVMIEVDGAVDERYWTASCELYGVAFVLRGKLRRVEQTTATGGSVSAIWLSPKVYVRNQRRATRLPLAEGDVILRWAQARDGSLKVVASPVVDLTPTGAAIRLRPPHYDFFSGSPVPAELCLGHVSLPITVDARWHREDEPSSDLVGLHMNTGDCHEVLVRAYLQYRFPRLVPRRQVSANRLSSLLRASGYLDLRPGEGASAAWSEFDEGYSVDVVYEADDKSLIGHISATRVYSSTWMFHQLATLGGHRESGICRKMLYELVSSVPNAFDGQRAFALAYFNLELRWHKLLFSEFVEWLSNEALGVVFTWDRFEHDPAIAIAPSAEGCSGYRVETLPEHWSVPATALVRSHLPALLANALNIHPQQLQTDRLNGAAIRTRRALALFKEEQLLGVALCETGPVSASLFNLLNIAQFFFVTRDGALTNEAQLALLGTVRQFYGERGVHDPIIVAPTGTFAAAAEPGTELAESMGCVAMASEGIRQWEDYCRFRMGQLYLRQPRQPKPRSIQEDRDDSKHA